MPIRVPIRAKAAAWYAESLGFESVESFNFWATAFEGGPLQITADGGKSMGEALVPGDIVDFDLCWAFAFADPWGNRFELNCCEYERIAIELIAEDEIGPVRYWPRGLHEAQGG